MFFEEYLLKCFFFMAKNFLSNRPMKISPRFWSPSLPGCWLDRHHHSLRVGTVITRKEISNLFLYGKKLVKKNAILMLLSIFNSMMICLLTFRDVVEIKEQFCRKWWAWMRHEYELVLMILDNGMIDIEIDHVVFWPMVRYCRDFTEIPLNAKDENPVRSKQNSVTLLEMTRQILWIKSNNWMLYHGYGSKLGTPIVEWLYIYIYIYIKHVESVAPKVLNYAYTQSV